MSAFVFADSFEAHRASFLESLRVRGYAAASLKSYGGSVAVFFRFLAAHGIDDIREADRETVRAYALELAGPGRYTTHTRHVHLRTLRRFFEHLEATDAVLLNPCLGLVLPKLEDRLPRTILTAGEVKRLLDAPDTQEGQGIRDKAILELFYSTGIRLEEMARLTIHDADWRNGFIRVTKGKHAKDRVVPMGAKAAQYVREYLEKVRRLWSGENRDERALWLSSRKPHCPLKSQMIQVMVKQYARQCGIGKPVTPHVWRHSCATHLLSGGASLMHVKQLLGHRSLKTTQVYTRVSVGEMKAAHRRAHPRSRIK
ncbi:MAG: tyrosine-type recombinase/integrase [Verrucomicrobiota bacterium]